jgi:hypothetical protein
MAQARTKGKTFNVGGEDKRKASATRPVVIFALVQRNEIVAIVASPEILP